MMLGFHKLRARIYSGAGKTHTQKGNATTIARFTRPTIYA